MGPKSTLISLSINFPNPETDCSGTPLLSETIVGVEDQGDLDPVRSVEVETSTRRNLSFGTTNARRDLSLGLKRYIDTVETLRYTDFLPL